MSLTPQTLRRLPKIKQGLLRGDNYTTIGQTCGVTEKTIDRDMQAWVESGDYEKWIKTEWTIRYAEFINNPKLKFEAFRNLTKLVTRMITKRIEAHTVEEIREIKLMWIKDESNPTNKISATQRAKRIP